MPKTTLVKQGMIPLAIFLLALAVRVPGLDGFVTIDEPQWIDRSRWFLTGLLFPAQECPPVEWGRQEAATGPACTLQIGYPGVTTMWAGSLGLLIHYWQPAGPTGQDLLAFLQSLPIFRLDPAVLPSIRLPLAVAGALFVPCFYLLLQRLFNWRVGLVAALLVALHPFHIALSRVLHHDALTATFMTLSLLALAGFWLRGWRWYWLPISAGLGGLALLSKQTSWFLPPFVAVMAAFTWACRWRTEYPRRSGPIAARLVAQGTLWGLLAGLTFVALFPAMWVSPLAVLGVIYGASTGLADAGHTHYFLGDISRNPGPFFYPVGWLLRATPLEILGVLGISVAGVWRGIRHQSLKWLIREQPVAVVLFLFLGLLWLFVSIPEKKMLRYFLPAFPIINVFAAAGLLWLLDGLVAPLRSRLGVKKIRQYATLLLAGLILVGQGWLAASHYPYYLTYYNPLTGGMPGAARLMTIIGWGEGANEAAAFLNQQPQAEELKVVTERYCRTVRPFFVGHVFCLNSSAGGVLQADYLVYYYNVVQRKLEWPKQWRYLAQHYQPAYVVRVQGLDYVTVYRNPIQHLVDKEANSLPDVLKTFGYNLSPEGQLTVIWQNLGMEQQKLLVGLAATSGVYPAEGGATPGERRWVVCAPAPDFMAERNTQAIIESHCPLTEAGLSPGLYDAQLAVGNGAKITPIESSRLAVLHVDSEGRFENVDLIQAAQLMEADGVQK